MMQCVFSYFLAEDTIENERVLSDLSVEKKFGKYSIRIDERTPYAFASKEKIECAVFGLAVNVLSGMAGDVLVQKIVENCENIQDFVEYERQLGGKYLLLFKIDEQYYMQGDATCSLPVFYNTEGTFVSSSNYQYIVNEKKYSTDSDYAKIRASGDVSQAMPYDITPYRQIKQLIPNHYLDINQQKAVRFVNSTKKQKTISIDEATERVLPMIQNLLAFYQQQYKIYCPITSGRDSRVVLSFLMENGNAFSCYTIKHPEHNEHTQDITVPIMLCKQEKIEHRLIEDITVLDGLKNELDGLLGKENYSLRTLRIAQTIKTYFGDGAIINGDIIGQVGKCSLHRDIPSIFATPSYFRCKLHNYSKDSKKQLRCWLKEIKISGEKVNTFDLFSIENRLGRWAGQEALIYNTIGQVYLNIFNSRSIIYIWSEVDRGQRKKAMIHTDLIKKTHSTLLGVTFESDDGVLIKISKTTGMAYLISSYLKFYVEKVKYKRRMCREKIDNYCR